MTDPHMHPPACWPCAQLLYLPGSCSAYTVYPPPSAPPPPPDAPVLVRQPYSIWRSAVLGGILGGVFVAQIIVLAVSTALAMTRQEQGWA